MIRILAANKNIVLDRECPEPSAKEGWSKYNVTGFYAEL